MSGSAFLVETAVVTALAVAAVAAGTEVPVVAAEAVVGVVVGDTVDTAAEAGRRSGEETRAWEREPTPGVPEQATTRRTAAPTVAARHADRNVAVVAAEGPASSAAARGPEELGGR